MNRNKEKAGSSPREHAVGLIYEIFEKGAYANLLLEKRMRHARISLADRRMLTEMVNGTVRMVKHLDWVLNLLLKGDISSQHPWLRAILRVAAYQLLFMERVPDYAAVNEAVHLAGKKAGKGLSRVVNGVLRSLIRQRDNLPYPEEELAYLSVYYSHPEWVVGLLIEQYGLSACREILAYNNRVPALTLRANQLHCTPEQLKLRLEGEGVACQTSPCWPDALRVTALNQSLNETDAFRSGLFYVQNEASMLPAQILKPRSGTLVYDLCCGVGGKSSHLAELMQNRGAVKAFDRHGFKIRLLQDNCRRLGITIVEGHAADITGLPAEMPEAEAVLLDAPCSGLGVLARRSDSRWKKSPVDLAQLPPLQVIMLDQASRLVARGGLLLYSTCTLNRAENQQVVEGFLLDHPGFVLEGFAAEIVKWPLDKADLQDSARGMLTVLPGKYDSDGMFFALMRRKR